MKKRGSIGDRPEQVDAGLGRPTPGCYAKTGPSKQRDSLQRLCLLRPFGPLRPSRLGGEDSGAPVDNRDHRTRNVVWSPTL